MPVVPAATGRLPTRRETVPFGLVALVGLVLAALPGPNTDGRLFGLAIALTAAIALGATFGPPRWRAAWLEGAPFLYTAAVAIMRHSIFGTSGFSALLLLPVVWLALFGSRRRLIAGLIAVAIVLLVPF